MCGNKLTVNMYGEKRERKHGTFVKWSGQGGREERVMRLDTGILTVLTHLRSDCGVGDPDAPVAQRSRCCSNSWGGRGCVCA